jgi:hypothetical protein
MKYQANLQIESKQIGTAPQTTAAPETPGRVIFRQFGVPSTQPLRDALPVTDFIRELESDPEMALRLDQARRKLSDVIDKPETFRHLRLDTGLSQSNLAALASTTQAYIARVELGTLDPGTDMLARLALALGTDETTVFLAVRAQRVQKESARVG